MKGLPVWYPDMNVWDADCPLTWPVNVRHNGQPLDVTDLDLTVPVTNYGVEKGLLTIEIVDADHGRVNLRLESELLVTLNQYSLWFLRENSEFRAPLVRGRIVRLT